MPQSFGRGIHVLICRRRGNFFTLAPTQCRMNRALELGGSRVNGFGQRNRLVTHFERLERTRVSFHTAAHIALTGMVRNAPAEMDLNESHPILVAIQRAPGPLPRPETSAPRCYRYARRHGPESASWFCLIRCV